MSYRYSILYYLILTTLYHCNYDYYFMAALSHKKYSNISKTLKGTFDSKPLHPPCWNILHIRVRAAGHLMLIGCFWFVVNCDWLDRNTPVCVCRRGLLNRENARSDIYIVLLWNIMVSALVCRYYFDVHCPRLSITVSMQGL